MIKLYHGSNQEITEIDLKKGKKHKDFGRGFYSTHIRQQAVFWSRRIAERLGGEPHVTKYLFDIDKATGDGLKIKIFEKPDREWALFVMANRNQRAKEICHNYDIIIGPVADDNMARLFGLYDLNIIDLDTLVAGLQYKDLNSQYFFATELSLNYLTKL